MREVGGERNRGQQLGKAKAVFGSRLVDYGLTTFNDADNPPIIERRETRRRQWRTTRRTLPLEETRTEQIDLRDAFQPNADERDLLDYLARLPVAAQPETPGESVSTPDLCTVRVQNLEV